MYFVFRGKKQTVDLDTVAKRFGIFGNVTLSPNWYPRSMYLDPIKWYCTVSYGVLTIVTIQIILYSNRDCLITWRQKLINIFKQNAIAPQAESQPAINFAGSLIFFTHHLKYMGSLMMESYAIPY